MNRKYILGFTLAEVLITLVIVGVIAAITVPSLINKTNNQEYVSRLKKAYSTLAQTTNLIITEEGPVQGWAKSADSIYNMYKKYLINAKDCGANDGCISQGLHYHLNGSSAGDWNGGNYRTLILSDGTQIIFNFLNENCNSSYGGSSDRCAKIQIDINGAKKPNKLGRDTFSFDIKKNGLYPAGCDNPDDINACNITGAGWGCACKVLREGAMNY